MTLVTATILSLSLGLGGSPLRAQKPAGPPRPPATPARPTGSVWDGVYTIGQATRGGELTERCVACHGPDLAGEKGPTLIGPAFAATWNGWTLGDMFERIAAEMRALARTRDVENKDMPAGDRETLNSQRSADVLAYLLLKNRFPTGNAELPVSLELLRQIRFQAAKP